MYMHLFEFAGSPEVADQRTTLFIKGDIPNDFPDGVISCFILGLSVIVSSILSTSKLGLQFHDSLLQHSLTSYLSEMGKGYQIILIFPFWSEMLES